MNVNAARRSRPYTMSRRAASAAHTAQRILQAAIDLHVERFHDQITLEDIAERAGVTVQTVLRRFGSREELVDAAADHATAQVIEQRGRAPVGDVAGAVDNLLDHYAEWGASALRLLSQEDRVPQLRRVTDRGRELHGEWVRRAFAPFLEDTNAPALLEPQLVAITDVYVWKVLHLDLGLERADTAAALIGMIRAVVQDGRAA